jgi:ribosome-associated heat shock protein Hsp15
MSGVRIDKWLWSIRFYKTRTLSTESCRSGYVKNSRGIVLKASAETKPGETLNIRKAGITFSLRVDQLISKRVSAELAKQCYTDLTPESELQKFESWFLNRKGIEFRDKGTGRPTKKERREIDDFKDYDFEDFDEYHEV